MGKRGRPSKFNETLAETILALAQTGETDEGISGKLGIPLRTLNNWKGRHPDFRQALRDSKSVADDLVEATLFQLALGYRHPAIKVVYDREKMQADGKTKGAFVTQGYMEMLAPDAAACMFWLRNRRPEDWRSNPPEPDPGDDPDDPIDVEWRVELVGEKPASMGELRAMAERYYDRKPAPLKVVGPDEPS